jgi:glutamine amidotransferase
MADKGRQAIVGVINYGAGNLGNVQRALKRLDIVHATLESPGDMKELDPSLLLLPGVGAYRPAMASLVSTGWRDALFDWAGAGKPLLGICLGMQLLCTRGFEDGNTNGLSLIEGDTVKLSGVAKIPHMGWNTAVPCDDNFPTGCMSRDGQNFYFVHSYVISRSPHCAALTEVDGVSFCSILRRGSVAGFQFHPERSGEQGVQFLGKAINYFYEEYSCRKGTKC